MALECLGPRRWYRSHYMCTFRKEVGIVVEEGKRNMARPRPTPTAADQFDHLRLPTEYNRRHPPRIGLDSRRPQIARVLRSFTHCPGLRTRPSKNSTNFADYF